MADIYYMMKCINTCPISANAKSEETCIVSNLLKANHYNHIDLTQNILEANHYNHIDLTQNILKANHYNRIGLTQNILQRKGIQGQINKDNTI
jgi:hypothetical protein